MSETRRDAVAKALHAVDVRLREEEGDFGVATRPWEEAGAYTRGVFGEYADAALAAIDAATPGPATVSEADVEKAIRRYRDAVRDAEEARYTAVSVDEQTRMCRFEEKALTDLRTALAARTTARAPEPSEAEIDEAFEAYLEATRAGMIGKERMRFTLIAARNAGQGTE